MYDKMILIRQFKTRKTQDREQSDIKKVYLSAFFIETKWRGGGGVELMLYPWCRRPDLVIFRSPRISDLCYSCIVYEESS